MWHTSLLSILALAALSCSTAPSFQTSQAISGTGDAGGSTGSAQYPQYPQHPSTPQEADSRIAARFAAYEQWRTPTARLLRALRSTPSVIRARIDSIATSDSTGEIRTTFKLAAPVLLLKSILSTPIIPSTLYMSTGSIGDRQTTSAHAPTLEVGQEYILLCADFSASDSWEIIDESQVIRVAGGGLSYQGVNIAPGQLSADLLQVGSGNL